MARLCDSHSVTHSISQPARPLIFYPCMELWKHLLPTWNNTTGKRYFNKTKICIFTQLLNETIPSTLRQFRIDSTVFLSFPRTITWFPWMTWYASKWNLWFPRTCKIMILFSLCFLTCKQKEKSELAVHKKILSIIVIILLNKWKCIIDDYFDTINANTVMLIHKSLFWINQHYLQNVSQGCENWSTRVTYSNVWM